MSASVDLYEYKEVLTKDVKIMEWVAKHGSQKAAWIVRAEEEEETDTPMPPELVEAIKKAGYEEEDAVLVVYND
jgi:hypothetical protein